MGIEGLLRYRHTDQTWDREQRWGFFCPKTTKVWISSSPDKVVKVNGAINGYVMSHNPFESKFWKRVWVLEPVVEIDEEEIWE